MFEVHNSRNRRVVVSADRATATPAVEDPAVDMWLWQRELPPVISASAARLVDRPLSMRATVQCHEPRVALTESLQASGVSERELHLWAHELGSLVGLVGELGYQRVLVRLQASDRVMPAPLFHVDGVRSRLLCTYHGPGTEWLPEHQVNRRQLGRHRGDEHANARIARSSRSAQRIEPGWVAIIRGASGATARRRGLVHRSPASALPRLLLRIDPLSSEGH